MPDFEPDKAPDYRPAPDATGMAAIAGDAPFIMKSDGRGWLFAPRAQRTAPCRRTTSRWNLRLPNLLYRQRANPTLETLRCAAESEESARMTSIPIVATNYRLTEHYLSGPMSRFNSWLNELQPEMFVEISPELAAEKGIEHGGWMVVWNSSRGDRSSGHGHRAASSRCTSTAGRMHQIGMPFHWGFAGETVGPIANDLTSIAADPNVSMHEAKAFTVNVRAGRLEASTSGDDAAWRQRLADRARQSPADTASRISRKAKAI